jgi:hypothetical protein
VIKVDSASRRLEILALGAAAAYSPAMLYATQSLTLIRGYRLIIIAAGVLVGLGAIVAVLRATGLERSTAYFSTSLVWLAVAIGGESSGPRWLAAIVSIAVVAILWRLRDTSLPKNAMAVLTIFLAVAPPAQFVASRVVSGGTGMETRLSAVQVDLPLDSVDIWVLVLDGYPSKWTLQAQFGVEHHRLEESLVALGFDVNPDAVSPYSATMGTLASVLEGDYVLGPGTQLDQYQMARVGALVGGDGSNMRKLAAAGYSITMIESGWHLSSCGDGIDTCVASSWYDETTSALWSRSALPWLTGLDLGSPFTRGTLRTFRQLADLVETLPHNGRSDLVFAHALAPHPPMYLDATCERTPSVVELGGQVFASPSFDAELLEQRKTAFLGQLACVDRATSDLVSAIPPGDAVMVFGDHGTDSLGQSALAVDSWTTPMIRERLLTLAALRVPGCDFSPLQTVDLFMLMIACLSGSELEALPPRAFAISNLKDDIGRPQPVAELSAGTVEDLLSIATR